MSPLGPPLVPMSHRGAGAGTPSARHPSLPQHILVLRQSAEPRTSFRDLLSVPRLTPTRGPGVAAPQPLRQSRQGIQACVPAPPSSVNRPGSLQLLAWGLCRTNTTHAPHTQHTHHTREEHTHTPHTCDIYHTPHTSHTHHTPHNTHITHTTHVTHRLHTDEPIRGAALETQTDSRRVDAGRRAGTPGESRQRRGGHRRGRRAQLGVCR